MTPDPVELSVDQVRPLRRSVLRAGMGVQDVAWADDDVDGVFHIGIVDGGEVVAVSTWIPRAAPDDLMAALPVAEPAVQLRGMATAAVSQGAGLGGLVLEHGCAVAASRGFVGVWANGRDAALNFYRRHGFVVVEPGFVDATTQLAHHRIWRELHPPGIAAIGR